MSAQVLFKIESASCSNTSDFNQLLAYLLIFVYEIFAHVLSIWDPLFAQLPLRADFSLKSGTLIQTPFLLNANTDQRTSGLNLSGIACFLLDGQEDQYTFGSHVFQLYSFPVQVPV